MLWAGQSGIQTLAVVRDFSHPQNVLTTAGTHGQNGALLPRIKQVLCEAHHSPPCTAKVNLLVPELNAQCDVQLTRIYMGLHNKRRDRLLAFTCHWHSQHHTVRRVYMSFGVELLSEWSFISIPCICA
jgi:hypothetical protein